MVFWVFIFIFYFLLVLFLPFLVCFRTKTLILLISIFNAFRDVLTTWFLSK